MTGEIKKSNKKLIVIILVCLLIVGAVEIYFGLLQKHEVANNVKIDGVFLAKSQVIQDFSLTSTDNEKFTKDNLNGKWTFMFFGFTNCGMVCPTTMAAMNGMYKILEKTLPKNKLPQVVMISVDPDRDSIERMRSYVNSFNSQFIGARGSITETIKLEKQLHIAAAKIQADGQGKDQYTINHSAEVLLFNAKGELQAYLSYPHKAEQMAKDYELILKSVG